MLTCPEQCCSDSAEGLVQDLAHFGIGHSLEFTQDQDFTISHGQFFHRASDCLPVGMGDCYRFDYHVSTQRWAGVYVKVIVPKSGCPVIGQTLVNSGQTISML